MRIFSVVLSEKTNFDVALAIRSCLKTPSGRRAAGNFETASKAIFQPHLIFD
jgi:hypothetical protein